MIVVLLHKNLASYESEDFVTQNAALVILIGDNKPHQSHQCQRSHFAPADDCLYRHMASSLQDTRVVGVVGVFDTCHDYMSYHYFGGRDCGSNNNNNPNNATTTNTIGGAKIP